MINTVSKGLLLNLCVKIARKTILEYMGVYWTNSYMQLIWWIQWDWDFISCEINGSEVLLFGSNRCKRGHSHTLLLVEETIFSGRWGWSSRAEAHLPCDGGAEQGTPAYCCSSLHHAAVLLLGACVSRSGRKPWAVQGTSTWRRLFCLALFCFIQPPQNFGFFFLLQPLKSVIGMVEVQVYNPLCFKIQCR